MLSKRSNNNLKSIFFVIIGLFLGLIILELSLRGLGYVLSHKADFSNIKTKQPNELRILTLGDSMTDSGLNKSYPIQLQEILSNNKNVKKNIKVINGGVGGTSSQYIVENLESYIYQYNPDIVVTMTGVNSDNIVEYEQWANVKRGDLLNNIKTIKLIKYLYKNLTNKLNHVVNNTSISKAYASENNIDQIIEKLRKTYSNYLDTNNTPKELELNQKLNNSTTDKDQIYMEFSDYYASIWDRERQVIFAIKALSINPNIARAYWRLSTDITDILTFDEKEKLLLKVLEINPYKVDTYVELGGLYSHSGNYLHTTENHTDKEKELNAYLKGIENIPTSTELWFWLGKYYYRLGNYSESERALKKAISLKNIDSANRISNIYQVLARIYKIQNKPIEEKNALDLATKTNDVLENNYIIIANILKRRGVKHIAMQYPLRDVNVLQSILKNYDVLFVDNKSSFEEAIKNEGTEKFFVDLFAGDFGHCTEEGNRIMANNVATVILNNFNLEK